MIILHERMLRTRRGSNPQPPDHQSDAQPTEPPRPASQIVKHLYSMIKIPVQNRNDTISVSLCSFVSSYADLLGHMSRNMRKHTFVHVRPTKTQINLRIRAIWSESSSSVCRNFASWSSRNEPSEVSDQTARMRRMVWFFAGRAYACRQIQSVWTSLYFGCVWYIYNLGKYK